MNKFETNEKKQKWINLKQREWIILASFNVHTWHILAQTNCDKFFSQKKEEKKKKKKRRLDPKNCLKEKSLCPWFSDYQKMPINKKEKNRREKKKNRKLFDWITSNYLLTIKQTDRQTDRQTTDSKKIVL